MRLRPTTAAAAAVTLVASLGATFGMTTSADAARSDHSAAAKAQARAALADAKAALRPSASQSPREATLALRDLFVHQDALTGAERASAESILSRPTTPGDDNPYEPGVEVKTACGEFTCLHWVEEGDDAADPAYAASTLQTMEDVHQTFVDAGYDAPLPDGDRGGNDKPDIYLSNIGPDGLYGYCTSDQQDWTDGFAVWAYCVLDNDYASDEFPANTPLENMQVTAAHEYYHAVQFAYDANEDAWLMEATATWSEDEVYDDVNDNLFYLQYGQLGDPTVPMDLFGFQSYGNWIFFRFLTEQFTETEGELPDLLLDIWERADSKAGAPDDYSSQAIDHVLHDHGTSMREQYGDFAAANGVPGWFYEEGAGSDTEDAYPIAPYRWPLTELSQGKHATKWKTTKLDHLTSATTAFTPGKSLKGKKRLKVMVDMADTARGSEARVMIAFADGPVIQTIKLNKKGNGKKTVPFDYDDVLAVEVTLANASARMSNCYTASWQAGDPLYSCYGFPKDDKQKARLKVIAKK